MKKREDLNEQLNIIEKNSFKALKIMGIAAIGILTLGFGLQMTSLIFDLAEQTNMANTLYNVGSFTTNYLTIASLVGIGTYGLIQTSKAAKIEMDLAKLGETADDKSIANKIQIPCEQINEIVEMDSTQETKFINKNVEYIVNNKNDLEI